MKNLEIHCSPLTSTIYVGNTNGSGMFTGQKKDLTDMAVRAVAQHLLQKNEKVLFDYPGTGTFALSVTKIDLPERCSCDGDCKDNEKCNK